MCALALPLCRRVRWLRVVVIYICKPRPLRPPRLTRLQAVRTAPTAALRKMSKTEAQPGANYYYESYESGLSDSDRGKPSPRATAPLAPSALPPEGSDLSLIHI